MHEMVKSFWTEKTDWSEHLASDLSLFHSIKLVAKSLVV